MGKSSRTARRATAPRITAPPAVDPLQRALALAQAGRGAEAEPLCRRVLEHEPGHPGALTLLGILAVRSGHAAEAVELFGEAAANSPQDPAAHVNHGNAMRDSGSVLSALVCYDRAIALDATFADAHYNRGVALLSLRRHKEAVASFERTVATAPQHAAAWNNLGTAQRALGDFAAALSSYERAIAANPDHVNAHNNRGAMLHALERYEEALSSYERALALAPQHIDTLNNRAATLHELERYEDALESFTRALRAAPRNAEALINCAVTLNALERHEEALRCCATSLQIAPDHPLALSNGALALRSLRRLEEALSCIERAIEVHPRHQAAHFNRGLIQHDLGHFQEALASYDRALFLGRNDADIHRSRARTLESLKRFGEAAEGYTEALALESDGRFLRGACLHARMRVCDWNDFDAQLAAVTAGIERGEPVITPFAALALYDSPPIQRRAAEIFVREAVAPRSALPVPRHAPHQKIRIGYFSADFRNHAVAALAAEMFELHDRAHFELTAFSLGPHVRDELRTRIEPAFERFVDAAALSDEAVVARSRELEIDIAVDLGGYTQGARPRIFALRAAPIQASYLGYLGTLGGTFMDYLIADPVLVPAESRAYYQEKIAYLPSYQVNDTKRPRAARGMTRAQLGLPDDGCVFCCFNANYKITPPVFDSWMRILAAAPGSVLFLLAESPAAQSNLRARAAQAGIAPERVLFGGPLPFGDYLARYLAADLFLDTFPYNAGTTASDALWAGLPVLTCRGESFPARMAASVLTGAGLTELIAPDRRAYERLAIELAGNPARRAALRERLADGRDACALFDTPSVTRNLETVLRRMYGRYLDGLPPDHLDSACDSSGAAA